MRELIMMQIKIWMRMMMMKIMRKWKKGMKNLKIKKILIIGWI